MWIGNKVTALGFGELRSSGRVGKFSEEKSYNGLDDDSRRESNWSQVCPKAQELVAALVFTQFYV